MYAMLVKQLISDLRSWKTYLLKGIIPIIFVTIGFGFQATTDLNLTVIQNDKTTLSLSSSISAENKTLFWADFDSNNLFSFEVSLQNINYQKRGHSMHASCRDSHEL